MRPIDYAIKLMIANNLNNSYFTTLAESLYNEDNMFITEVLNYLEEHDSTVKNMVTAILDKLGRY